MSADKHKALGAYRQAVETAALSANKFHADVVSAGKAAASLRPFIGDEAVELAAIAWAGQPPVDEWLAQIPVIVSLAKGGSQ